MALEETRAPSGAIWSAVKGTLGLFADINKATNVQENAGPTPLDEYESSMDELQIRSLVRQWRDQYGPYYNEIEPTQKLAFAYWIGKHNVDASDIPSGAYPLIDNKLFEAIETFLPIATRAKPDPLVTADPSPQGQQLAKDLKNSLVYEADRQKLRVLLKKITRHWLIYRIGVLKITWDAETSQIKTLVVNPKRMVFDKNGYVDESGYFVGEYLGEKKKATAKRLIELFPKKRADILMKAEGKLGTELEYMEWWYQGTDVFFTIEDVVLGKYKNPHWNYDGETESVDPVTGTNLKEYVQGRNHFDKIRSPYIFLTVFNTGLQPHDETSLILQNVGIQDLINRRWKQIEKNVEGMNNGMVVSGTAFTDEQAAQAASALRRGVAIRVPNGAVKDAVERFPAPPLPKDVFENLQDGRNELRNIFGTSGSTPNGIDKEETARGKILVNQLDSSRIGGGVTEYIEQVADTWYNWVVQMMFVYYTDEHYINAIGAEGAAETITLTNQRFNLVHTLNVQVKEGSLIPKDPLTQRNEAMDLWSANAIDPRSLYQKLDYPDPNGAAKQLILWQMVQKGVLPPTAYIPDFPMPAPGAPIPPPGGGEGTPTAPGQGGPAVNPLGPATQPAPAGPGSPSAIEQQGKQLLESIPVPH